MQPMPHVLPGPRAGRHARRGSTFGAGLMLGTLLSATAAIGASPPRLDTLQSLRSAAGMPGASVRNCASDDRLSFGADDRALLDDGDRDRVQAAMMKRFPVLQRHGFGASAIIVWHRQNQDWIYIALAHEGEDPREACYTATFSAEVFDFTPVLLRKYFLGQPRS